MLRVILLRFVRAFDQGGPPQSDKAFWERMINRVGPRASGTITISGWMGAFCAWDNKGRFFRRDSVGAGPEGDLTFDDVSFPHVDPCFPEGYAEVDVLLLDFVTGTKIDCAMLAGHVAMAVEGPRRDTIRIAPQWFMYAKGKERAQGWGFWRLQV
jgi:hypothetical protein